MSFRAVTIYGECWAILGKKLMITVLAATGYTQRNLQVLSGFLQTPNTTVPSLSKLCFLLQRFGFVLRKKKILQRREREKDNENLDIFIQPLSIIF